MTSTAPETSSACATDAVEIELDPVERAELLALVSRIAPGSVDDPRWQEQCRAAGALPQRIGALVRAFRHDPGPEGTAFLAKLPLGAPALPPTPREPDSAEPHSTTPAVLSLLLGNELGTVVAYRDEKRGSLVQNVVPVHSLAGSQSNGGSVELELHTENAFHPHRPDYVGLLCLRSAHEDRIGTRVASIRRALPLLSSTARGLLQEARFVTEAPPSFRAVGRSEPRPVLTGAPEDPDVCVDFNATRALDRQAGLALDHLREALLAVCRDLVLDPGDMVFVDNRIAVHGRAPFTPRYDGSDRWLHRVFVHLDHRRSRPHRSDNGVVLG
ncbi:L-asparagine oxygenase [Catenulispora sp. GP43]|uniref:TauD/TfdA family dioxygenase n=1 Tax=Catenulispora sp. GP43 TaxID=3156263 RepID=UPI0035198072